MSDVRQTLKRKGGKIKSAVQIHTQRVASERVSETNHQSIRIEVINLRAQVVHAVPNDEHEVNVANCE